VSAFCIFFLLQYNSEFYMLKSIIFEKLSKLFCFWEDNLALAIFQCPTDTPLNHNLLMLTFRTERKKQKNKNHCKNAAVFKKNMTVSVSRVLS